MMEDYRLISATTDDQDCDGYVVFTTATGTRVRQWIAPIPPESICVFPVNEHELDVIQRMSEAYRHIH